MTQWHSECDLSHVAGSFPWADVTFTFTVSPLVLQIFTLEVFVCVFFTSSIIHLAPILSDDTPSDKHSLFCPFNFFCITPSTIFLHMADGQSDHIVPGRSSCPHLCKLLMQKSLEEASLLNQRPAETSPGSFKRAVCLFSHWLIGASSPALLHRLSALLHVLVSNVHIITPMFSSCSGISPLFLVLSPLALPLSLGQNFSLPLLAVRPLLPSLHHFTSQTVHLFVFSLISPIFLFPCPSRYFLEMVFIVRSVFDLLSETFHFHCLVTAMSCLCETEGFSLSFLFPSSHLFSLLPVRLYFYLLFFPGKPVSFFPHPSFTPLPVFLSICSCSFVCSCCLSVFFPSFPHSFLPFFLLFLLFWLCSSFQCLQSFHTLLLFFLLSSPLLPAIPHTLSPFLCALPSFCSSPSPRREPKKWKTQLSLPSQFSSETTILSFLLKTKDQLQNYWLSQLKVLLHHLWKKARFFSFLSTLHLLPPCIMPCPLAEPGSGAKSRKKRMTESQGEGEWGGGRRTKDSRQTLQSPFASSWLRSGDDRLLSPFAHWGIMSGITFSTASPTSDPPTPHSSPPAAATALPFHPLVHIWSSGCMDYSHPLMLGIALSGWDIWSY